MRNEVLILQGFLKVKFNGEPQRTPGTFPGQDRFLFHSGVGTLYAKGPLREQSGHAIFMKLEGAGK